MIVRDSITIVFMLLVNAFAFLSSRRLLRLQLCDSGVCSLIAGQIVLIWSAIAGVVFALNAIACLSPWTVYGGVLFLSLCGFVYIQLRNRNSGSSMPGAVSERVAIESASKIGDVCREVEPRNALETSPNGSNRVTGLSANSLFAKTFDLAKHIDWFVIGMTLLATLGIAQIALFGIAQFPMDWDTMAYHLPIVDHWIQTGQLGNQRCAFWYVPGNSELLAYWFTAPLSGDFWAQLNNIPPAVLLVVSLVAIGGIWKLDRKWQFVLAVLAVGCQPMMRQLTSLENDLGAAALFVASLLFGIRWVQDRRTIDLGLFVASVGLLAGIKYYALGYTAVSIGAVVAASWFLRGWRVAIRTSIASLIGCMLFGSYWYVRNYLLTGSPLFPLGMEALGIPDQWASMRPESETSTLLRGSTREVWSLLLKAWLFQAGPIALVAILLSPLFGFVGVIWSWKKLRGLAPELRDQDLTKTEPTTRATSTDFIRKPNGFEPFTVVTLVLSLVVLGSLAVYFVTPNVIETDTGSRNMLRMQYHSVRFGYCLGLISILFFVKVLSLVEGWLGKMHRWIAIAFVVSIYGLSISTLIFYLLPQYGWRQQINRLGLPFFRQPRLDYSALEWGLVTADIFLALLVAGSMLKTERFRIGAICFVFALATPWLSHNWHKNYDAFYSVVSHPLLSLRLRSLSGEKSFCICDYRYYASIGSDRAGQAFRPLFVPTSESFREFLDLNKITIVAVPYVDSHWSKTYAKPRDWIQSWPTAYRKKEEVDGFSIYELIESKGSKE